MNQKLHKPWHETITVSELLRWTKERHGVVHPVLFAAIDAIDPPPTASGRSQETIRVGSPATQKLIRLSPLLSANRGANKEKLK